MVAAHLRFGAQDQPCLLVIVCRLEYRVRVMLEVPSFPALLGTQALGPVGAGRAAFLERRPAWHEDLLNLPRHDVCPAELDRADAPALSLGELADRVTSQ